MPANNNPSAVHDALRSELTTDGADLSPVHFIIHPDPDVTLDVDEVLS